MKHVLFVLFLAFLVLSAKEKSFVETFPEAPATEITAATNLEKELDLLDSLRKEANGTASALKTAIEQSENKDRCCQEEGEKHLAARKKYFLAIITSGGLANQFMKAIAQDPNQDKKIQWLRKKLNEVGIQLQLTVPKSSPRPPGSRSYRACFLLKIIQPLQSW